VKTKKGKGGKKTTGERKKRTMNQPKYKASKELEAVVKQKELTRPEATKKIWDYIKENKLQDPGNKRRIIPDDTLGKIIGSEPIDMMKLSGFLSKHLKK